MTFLVPGLISPVWDTGESEHSRNCNVALNLGKATVGLNFPWESETGFSVYRMMEFKGNCAGMFS
jgi:hypothetical protein